MSMDVRQIAPQVGPQDGVAADRLGRDDPALAGSTVAAAEFARSTGTIPATALPLSQVVAALRGGEDIAQAIALAAPPLLPRLRPPNGYVTIDGEPSLRLPVTEANTAPFERAAWIAPQAFSRPVVDVPATAEEALARMVAGRDRLSGSAGESVVPTADLVQRDGRAVGQPGLRVSGLDYMVFLSIAGGGSDAVITANVLSRSPGGTTPVLDGSGLSRGAARVELTPEVRSAIATILEAAGMPADGPRPTLSDHATLLAIGGIRG